MAIYFPQSAQSNEEHFSYILLLFFFVSRMEAAVQILSGEYYSARRVVWAGISCPQVLFCPTNVLALCLLHSWASATSELSNKNKNLLNIVCPFILLPWVCAMDCLVWTKAKETMWLLIDMYFSHQRLSNAVGWGTVTVLIGQGFQRQSLLCL